ncbi:restriction endonuclease subunit S [Paenibacillus sp. LHD-117]|uniref:restriction endonuclease subunit S n=1 Tax=Paenibacillus sp. LHD-117 TaxID=3071412 RepID=UPI0027E14885|nr:restriction endonuclease subunit S [Paenibacillus sp. LHD-117]MDQ6420516.1 restriction endonuclease subunit S [Paenibacillus sp. LHD-117]
MFVENPDNQWKKLKLDDVCSEIYRYPTFYGLEYKPSGIPVIRIGNILSSGVVDPELNNYVFIDEEVSMDYPRTIIELNDIVMAVRGDGSTAKKIALVNSENLVNANISPNVLRFKANTNIVTPFYLFFFLTSTTGQSELNSHVKRTAKKNITATDIKGISIPVPPLDKQMAFSNLAKTIEQEKEFMISQLTKLEENFQALLHQAFTGRLQFRESKVDEYALKR